VKGLLEISFYCVNRNPTNLKTPMTFLTHLLRLMTYTSTKIDVYKASISKLISSRIMDRVIEKAQKFQKSKENESHKILKEIYYNYTKI